MRSFIRFLAVVALAAFLALTVGILEGGESGLLFFLSLPAAYIVWRLFLYSIRTTARAIAEGAAEGRGVKRNDAPSQDEAAR
jgi:hypothetical protein